jgi:chitin-binding protein
LNINCGAAEYEPQSVGETFKGFPAQGPEDGKLASGGNLAFAPLDVQTSTRWHKTPVSSSIEFSWHYIAGHNTTGWEYYVTRHDWNPNLPLTRASFDPAPFCTVQWNGTPPFDLPQGDTGPGKEKHRCQLPPDRQGHHVIYGIWTVDNTANAFYKVMDVDIGATDPGEPGPGWEEVGQIQPQRQLETGDRVKARAFVRGVEHEGYSTTIQITSTEEGQPQNWSYKLAQQINQLQSQVKAGQRDQEGNITPVHGSNTLYAKPSAGISSFELAYELNPGDEAYLHIHGLAGEYPLNDNAAVLDFSVMSNKKLTVTASLFDGNHKQVGSVVHAVDKNTVPFTLEAQSTAGEHLLKLVGISENGRVVLQEERTVRLVDGQGGHDYVFPQGIELYREGVRVLQPKNGVVYQCKPFPAEGWCRIYSASSNNYEPGVGAQWQDAWDAL